MKVSALGLMSGTSLDGIDIALCQFDTENYSNFDIVEAKTFKYTDNLEKSLRYSTQLTAIEYVRLHRELGFFYGQLCKDFLKGRKVDFIASHGHTSVHLPNQKVNFQLGDGASIASASGFPVICDFRSIDICLGGQGAPLVPIGDYFLFPQYDALLNIGGFSNITIKKDNKIKAFDVCPANFALNYFSQKLNLKFDEDGNLGIQGATNQDLLTKLNNLEYYKLPAPKSLSDHWFYEVFLPKINMFDIPTIDILRTLYEHISQQIANTFNNNSIKKIIITGGGALNKFLVELIKNKTHISIDIPNKKIIEYKEALIFAFLGLLRWQNKNNCLKSVTGAIKDNIGGAIYLP